MKKLTLLLPLLLLAGCSSTPSQTKPVVNAETPKVEATACTMDAKACPDGSYVGRTGPNCEFAACPTTTNATQSGANEPKTTGADYSCGITPNPNCNTGQ